MQDARKSEAFDGGEWLRHLEKNLESDPDYVAESLALQLTEQAARLMKKRGISKAQLADLMHVSRAYITRILNAPPNLTLRSIAQLGIALEAEPKVAFVEQSLAMHATESASGDTSPWSHFLEVHPTTPMLVRTEDYEQGQGLLRSPMLKGQRGESLCAINYTHVPSTSSVSTFLTEEGRRSTNFGGPERNLRREFPDAVAA